jgi:hypothetical protein
MIKNCFRKSGSKYDYFRNPDPKKNFDVLIY